MRRRRTRVLLLLLGAAIVAGAVCLFVHARERGTGAWLYDPDEGLRGLWYQEVETSPSPVGLPQASRAIAKYREAIHSIPGVNFSGIGKLANGDHYIEVGFASVKERDRAMRDDLIPPVLDGVPVRVDNLSGVVGPLG